MDTEAILIKTLKISEETHKRLAKIGTFGDSFEDIIKRLLDEHEAKGKK